MRLALDQARQAYEIGEVPTGCVVAQVSEEDLSAALPGMLPGRVIARAHNQVEMLKDPTAHAEMIAITQAAEALGDWRLENTVLYVTKEPCAMCAGAIVLARIPLVVYGTPDPKRGGAVSNFNILQDPNLNHRCAVISGILEDNCRNLLQEFFRAKR